MDLNSSDSSEYALHFLFSRFAKVAEKCIRHYFTATNSTNGDPAPIIGKGRCRELDSILESLGLLARKRPKAIIDCLMYWRKLQLENISNRNDRSHDLRPNCENKGIDNDGKINQKSEECKNYFEPSFQWTSSLLENSSTSNPDLNANINDAMYNALSLLSSYILSRALAEIVSMAGLSSFEPSLASRLESLVYGQLKYIHTDNVQRKSLRASTWTSFVELMGLLSTTRFSEVSDKFIMDLESLPDKFAVQKDAELQAEAIVLAMQYLPLKTYPLSDLEETAAFIDSLSKFFCSQQSLRIKSALASTLHILISKILMYICHDGSLPIWSSIPDRVIENATKFSSKGKYFPVGFPLISTATCLLPREEFQNEWIGVVELNIGRAKLCPQTFLRSTAQLVWIFLFRYHTGHNSSLKQIEQLQKTLNQKAKLFPGNTAPALNHMNINGPNDTYLNELVLINRYIGFKFPEHYITSQVMPLIRIFEQDMDRNIIPNDQTLITNITRSIDSLLLILADLQNPYLKEPPYPAVQPDDSLTLLGDVKSDGALRAMSPDIDSLVSNIMKKLVKILLFCDNYIGSMRKMSSHSPMFAKFANVLLHLESVGLPSNTSSYADDESPLTQLMIRILALLERFPSLFSNDHSSFELLCRNTLHQNELISSLSYSLVKQMAKTYGPKQLIRLSSKLIVRFDGIPEHNSLKTFYSSQNSSWIKFLELFLELLSYWEMNLLETDPKSPNKIDTTNTKNHEPSSVLENASSWACLEESESVGVYLLCSQVSEIREKAFCILNSISKINKILETSNVIHTSDTTETEENSSLSIFIKEKSLGLIQNINNELTAPELQRLDEILNKTKPNDLLQYMSESQNGIDTAIWQKAFPGLIKAMMIHSPVCVVLCREYISSRLLRNLSILMNFDGSEKPTNNSFTLDFSNKPNYPLQNLNNICYQWKLDMTILCSSITAIEDSTDMCENFGKLSFATSEGFRLNSARSTFRFFLPLLLVNNSNLRDSFILSLSYIQPPLFKILLEELQHLKELLNAEIVSKSQSKSLGFVRSVKDTRWETFNIQAAKILGICSKYLIHYSQDQWVHDLVIEYLNSFIRIVSDNSFFSDPEMAVDFKRQFFNFVQSLIEVDIPSCMKYRTFRFTKFSRKMDYELLKSLCRSSPEEGLDPNSETDKPREFWIPIDCQKILMSKLLDYVNLEGENVQLGHSSKNSLEFLTHSSNSFGSRGTFFDFRRSSSATIDTTQTSIQHTQSKINIQLLQEQAAGALATLYAYPGSLGLISDNSDYSDRKYLHFGWIESFLGSTNVQLQSTGFCSIINLCHANKQDKILMDLIYSKSYDQSMNCDLQKCYFFALSDLILNEKMALFETSSIIILCLYKLGKEDEDLRYISFLILLEIEQATRSSSDLVNFGLYVRSDNIMKILHAQNSISNLLSNLFPDMALNVFSIFCKIILNVNQSDVNLLSILILSWIEQIKLEARDDKGLIPPSTYMVLINMLDISEKFLPKNPDIVKPLWKAFVCNKDSMNWKIILQFLMHQCLIRHDFEFVSLCRQIIYIIGDGEILFEYIEYLIEYTNARYTLPYIGEFSAASEELERPSSITRYDLEFQMRRIKEMVQELHEKCSIYPYTSNKFDQPFKDAFQWTKKGKRSNCKPMLFSQAQLSLIFLRDLMTRLSIDRLKDYLPIVLQACFCYLDHFNEAFQDEVVTLLRVCLIFGATVHEDLEIRRRILNTSILLKMSRTNIWNYDDLKSQILPSSMVLLTHITLQCFENLIPSLKSLWSDISLSWATTCAVRHLACRSLQIFRCLKPDLKPSMFADLFARLTNTISDSSHDIQEFSIEILMTMDLLLEQYSLEGDSAVFWGILSLLTTKNETEYFVSLSLLRKFLRKWCALDAPVDFVTLALKAKPEDFQDEGRSLLDLIQIGFRSNKTIHLSYEVQKLLLKIWAKSPEARKTVTSSDILLITLSLAPKMLKCFEKEQSVPDCTEECEALLQILSDFSMTKLEKVIESFAKRKFRTCIDFSKQLISSLHFTFPVELIEFAIKLYFQCITNTLRWYRRNVLELLNLITPLDSRLLSEIISPEHLCPLLRILTTEDSTLALNIILEIETKFPGTVDKNVLRACSVNPRNHDVFLSSTEKFGIPDLKSGWAIANSNMISQITRQNLLTAYYAYKNECQNTDDYDTSQVTSHLHANIEFESDNFNNYDIPVDEFDITNDGQDDEEEKYDGNLSENSDDNGPSLDDLVSTLHHLDSFFSEDLNTVQTFSLLPNLDAHIEFDSSQSYPEFHPRLASALKKGLTPDTKT